MVGNRIHRVLVGARRSIHRKSQLSRDMVGIVNLAFGINSPRSMRTRNSGERNAVFIVTLPGRSSLMGFASHVTAPAHVSNVAI